jgi:integrase
MLPTALTSDQVSAMLTACAPAPKAYAVLLLNGVSPYELPLLHAGCFDADRWLIEIPGASRRHIEFSADHWSLLEPLLQRLTDAGRSIPVAELDQHYRQAARTAAIEGAADVSALGLWHSFVVYLVRQGIDFNDLQARVGTIVPEIEAALRDFAPPGATVAKELIHFSYPLQVA